MDVNISDDSAKHMTYYFGWVLIIKPSEEVNFVLYHAILNRHLKLLFISDCFKIGSKQNMFIAFPSLQIKKISINN